MVLFISYETFSSCWELGLLGIGDKLGIWERLDSKGIIVRFTIEILVESTCTLLGGESYRDLVRVSSKGTFSRKGLVLFRESGLRMGVGREAEVERGTGLGDESVVESGVSSWRLEEVGVRVR